MSVTATPPLGAVAVTARPVIRPPDPLVRGVTLAYMPIASHEATRRLVHLAFRDAHTALDLTYAHGGCWRDPLPPGLRLTTSNLDPVSAAELHLDFTATGWPDDSFDLVVYDPPHVADGGATSIMARRFGTVKGTVARFWARSTSRAATSCTWPSKTASDGREPGCSKPARETHRPGSMSPLRGPRWTTADWR